MPSVAYKDEFGTAIVNFKEETWTGAIVRFVGCLRAKGFTVHDFEFKNEEIVLPEEQDD